DPAAAPAAPAGDATPLADDATAVAAMPGADDAGDAGDASAARPGPGLVDKEGKAIALVPFDIESVPVSSASLGELPFFSMPTGYGPVNSPDQRSYARFPFRLGDGLHWVEGASWNSLLGVARDQRGDKEFSPLELRRNLEAVFAQAGAKQVFEGPLQRDLYYGPQLETEIGGGFIEGVNLGADTATSVHVIRQPDRNIWMQLSTHSHGA